MKASLCIAASLILLPTGFSGGASKGRFEYLSPPPGSTMVSPRTNIILRPLRGIESRSLVDHTDFRITGERTGAVNCSVILSDDSITVIIKPGRPFAGGESVTVGLYPGQGALDPAAASPFSFSFRVSAHQGEARPAVDDPSGALPDWKASRSARLPEETGPADFPRVTVLLSDNPSPGCLFLSNMTMGSGALNTPYVMILDNAGQPVFYRRTPSECTDFKVQPNGLITYNDSYLQCFLALDSSYAVVDTFRCGNGYSTNWHELRLLPNGHALILGDDPQIMRMDTIVPGGYSSALVQGIVIQELDRSKNVVFQWRTFDHFRVTDATHENLTSSFIDCVHSNAIEPDTDGNLMLSSRHLDEITKINRQTGEIIWRWGGRNNQFTFLNDSLGFAHQHAIRRLPDGNVSLFDNGDFRFPLFSRAVEYRLDEQKKTATLVWQFRHSPDIYASAMGYLQRLPNGSRLIDWGSSDTLLTEVRPDGSAALELTFPSGVYSYRAYRFPWKTTATTGIRTSLLPGSFSVEQNYPNPFNPTTTIGYRVPEAGDVTLEVMDILGRKVGTLVNGRQEAGDHSITFDGSRLSSGVYFYRLTAGRAALTKKMALVR